MREFLPLVTIFFMGCGEVTMSSFFPADGQSGGGTAPAVRTYAADMTGSLVHAQKRGLNLASGHTTINDLIDGDADLFLQKDVQALGWEVYATGNYQADIRVWQMKDTASATDTYGYLVTAGTGLHAQYKDSWTDLALGQAGRIVDTGSGYWVNVRKGAYIVDAKVTPHDDTAKQDATTFATTIISKIP